MKHFTFFRYLSLPAVMGLVFFLTFGGPGAFLCKILSSGISWWIERFLAALAFLKVPDPLHALLTDGICPGVGSVLSFLPSIAILFFCLSLLETSGYLSRAARWLDGPMAYFGLTGDSVIPLLTGFGCSVPAILAAGQMGEDGQIPQNSQAVQNPQSAHASQASRRRKIRTIFLVPFFSCSARLPIYSLIAGNLFPGRSTAIIIGLYLLGVGTGLFMAYAAQLIFPIAVSPASGSFSHLFGCFSHSLPDSPPACPSAAPLPALTCPDLSRALTATWREMKDFAKKAFTVIFLGAMIIWLLEHLDGTFHLTAEPSGSLLADLGRTAAPLFVPLGFHDWRAVSAVISGLAAKEAVVSTLTVMAQDAGLSSALPMIFSPASALSFLVFCLFYTPCIAALAAVSKELGSFRWAAAMMIFQCVFAWILSFLLFHFVV